MSRSIAAANQRGAVAQICTTATVAAGVNRSAQLHAIQQLLSTLDGEVEQHTLAEALARYSAEHLHCDGLAANTIAWRELAVRRLAKFGHRPVAGRFRDVAGQIYQEARLAGQTESTASLTVNTLNRVLRLARTWGWRSDDPDLQRLARVRSRARTRALSATDCGRLSEGLDRYGEASERLRVAAEACRLALLTGWRVGEVAGVEWQHVDLTERRVHLPQTKTGPRTHPIASVAADVIARQPSRGKSRWIFPRRRGDGPIHRRQVELAMSGAAKIAGLDGVVVHTLRHTFATLAAQLQLPTVTTAAALGHSCEWQTTRYQHVDETDVRALVERVARLAGAA